MTEKVLERRGKEPFANNERECRTSVAAGEIWWGYGTKPDRGGFRIQGDGLGEERGHSDSIGRGG
jgi:hypothetical protein